jgi:putative hydrolase of the HAD superfamily
MTAGAPIAVAAVGFDLGETLYHYGDAPWHWVERARPVLDRVSDACGIDRSKADIAAAHESMASYSAYLRERIERVSAADLMVDVLEALGGNAAERLETAVDAVLGLIRKSLEPYPDAVETLVALKRSGFAVGALTNVTFGTPRRTIQKDLTRLGLAPYLDCYVTSVDVGLRKPHRAAFEWLAAMLGVGLKEIAYVGNLPTDVAGALSCGCIPIFLDRTQTGRDYGQAATVRHLSEIPALLALDEHC